HHAGRGLRGPGVAGAPGEPGRAHPRRLPGHVAGMAQGQPHLHAGRRPGGDQAAADGTDARGPDGPVPPRPPPQVLPRSGPAAGPQGEKPTSEPEGRRGAWAEERGPSGGRRRRNGIPEASQGHSGTVALRVWRGDAGQGSLTDYRVEANEGEVVLDVL